MSTITGYNTNNTYMTGMMNTGQNAVMQAMQGGDMNSIFAGILGGTIDNIANAASEGASDTGKTLIQLGASILKMFMSFVIGSATKDANNVKQKGQQIDQTLDGVNKDGADLAGRIAQDGQGRIDNDLSDADAAIQKFNNQKQQAQGDIDAYQSELEEAMTEQQENQEEKMRLLERQSQLQGEIEKKKGELQAKIAEKRQAAEEQYISEHPELGSKANGAAMGLSDADIGFDPSTDSECAALSSELASLESEFSEIPGQIEACESNIRCNNERVLELQESLTSTLEETFQIGEESREAFEAAMEQMYTDSQNTQVQLDQVTQIVQNLNAQGASAGAGTIVEGEGDLVVDGALNAEARIEQNTVGNLPGGQADKVRTQGIINDTGQAMSSLGITNPWMISTFAQDVANGAQTNQLITGYTEYVMGGCSRAMTGAQGAWNEAQAMQLDINPDLLGDG